MAALAAAGIYLLLFHPVKQNVQQGEEALAQGAYRKAVQAYAAALSGPEVLAEETQKAREGLKQAVNILLERDPHAFDEALLVKLAGIWDGDTYSAFIQRLEGYLADREAEKTETAGA